MNPRPQLLIYCTTSYHSAGSLLSVYPPLCVGIYYLIRTSEMYHNIRSSHLFLKRLADLKMAAQRVESLRAICKICLQCMYVWVIQWCLVDIEYLMAVREQLFDNATAHHT